MKRPMQVILTGIVLVIGVFAVRNRMRARAEADLWAEATDQL
ncbi:MAG: DLW-39 family protein [Brooklawnia sp.]